MKGVKFGEKHSYNDFGLILKSKKISFPEPKLNEIDVPGSDGTIDLSTILTNGDVTFKNRTLEFTFSVIDPMKKWESTKSIIANYLHGKTMQIVLDDDPTFYYYGRCKINEFSSDKRIGTIVISATVEPYKYDIFSSTEDWIWDTFDFENGLVHEFGNIEVSGEKTLCVVIRRKTVTPTIRVLEKAGEEDFMIEKDGNTFWIYDDFNDASLFFSEGENTIKIIGNGRISIEFRGGSL